MGLCYQHAALGIVRGGTTTLAEAKLFDLPLIIVPLPVTHDQTTNAQWYVEHYGDSLISQNSSDFQARLQREIVNAALLATRARQDVNSDKQNTHSSAQAIIYQHILSFAQKY